MFKIISNKSTQIYNLYHTIHFIFQMAVAATYRAMASSPRSPHIGPVVMSELARRRTQGKTSGPTAV